MSESLLISTETSLSEAWEIVLNQLRIAVEGGGHPFRTVTLATVDEKSFAITKRQSDGWLHDFFSEDVENKDITNHLILNRVDALNGEITFLNTVNCQFKIIGP